MNDKQDPRQADLERELYRYMLERRMTRRMLLEQIAKVGAFAALAPIIAACAGPAASASASASAAAPSAPPTPSSAAATATPEPTPVPSPESLSPVGPQPAAAPNYTIKGGDTWEKVSEATGVPIQQLKQLNPAVPAGSSLPIGQTIKVR